MEWIKCSDRLPPLGKMTLIYPVYGDEIEIGEFCGNGWHYGKDETYWIKHTNITHWQPLPEPPKE